MRHQLGLSVTEQDDAQACAHAITPMACRANTNTFDNVSQAFFQKAYETAFDVKPAAHLESKEQGLCTETPNMSDCTCVRDALVQDYSITPPRLQLSVGLWNVRVFLRGMFIVHWTAQVIHRSHSRLQVRNRVKRVVPPVPMCRLSFAS